MSFGIIVLGLIAALGAAGTLIPQGKEPTWYARTYPELHGWIMLLKLNDIFNSWYFWGLLALLCLNLSLCSLVRIRRVVSTGEGELERAASLPNEQGADAGELTEIRKYLHSRHCKSVDTGPVTVWYKNRFGRYGSFITHLSILLVTVFGALALYVPTVTDMSCYPGESITMDDGTVITVEAFSIEDTEGKLDYNSLLHVTLPDGRQSGSARIRVNAPLSFGTYKIYQQTYGTAGQITVQNIRTGGEDSFYLTDVCFLSADGANGVWFDELYPAFVQEADGSVTLLASTSGHYPDPVYHITVASDGVFTPVLAFPGDELTVGELQFTFHAPVEYPGLRIKHTPWTVNALLFLAFGLMILGLTVTFFCVPVLVKTDEQGYAVGGLKPENTRMDIQILLESIRREDQR